MALVVERFYAGGIAQLSYLVGDDSEGVAAVIDPRPDCDAYLRKAEESGLAIKAIFETHIHADFMSGSRELSHRLGGAPIYASGIDAEDYGFDVERLSDGDRFAFGELILSVRHTPGHTPEHVSFLATQEGADGPFAVFSGDTLFVDSVGRPDLLGEDETQELAAKLHESIRGFYYRLDDGVIVYPGHGAGSSCGPDIGDRMITSIGYEKASNPYLKIPDKADFIEKTLASAPPEPRHYRPMKKVNACGPKVFNGFPPVEPLEPEAFKAALERDGGKLLDTRDMLAFGSAHIAGALNIAARPELSVWSGWMLEFDEPLYLVLEDDGLLRGTLTHLWRTGHTNVKGYLAGGMSAWIMAGQEVDRLEQIDVHRLERQLDEIQILDVRSPEEREKGFIPTSVHCFVPEVEAKAEELLDRRRPVATYCASGFRASIASSVLKRMGFERPLNVPGSFGAWTAAGKEVATEQPAEASR